MMPWYSTDAGGDTLDAWFGATTLGPVSYILRLWDDNPLDGGTEVTGANLTAPTIANNSTNFPAAVSGSKTTAPLRVGPSTGATGVALWASLERSDNNEGVWYGRLSEEWQAVGAGESADVTLTITTPTDPIS